MSPLMEAMVAENPCVRFANNQRGYVRFDLKPGELRADFRVVEYVSRPGADIRTRASFVVEDGHPGAQPA
jgi:alkaline phosphatase D